MLVSYLEKFECCVLKQKEGTPGSRVFVEKLIIVNQDKKCPASC
jgi:hypothetical protein